MADISKITLPSGSTYDLKDSGARQLIADIAAAGLTYVVVSELPAASSSTMGTIYLTPVATAGSNDNYDEWLTLRSGSAGSYTYSWEKIGNTSMDLSNYVADGDTISLGSITSGSNTTGISVSNHTVTQGTVSATGSFTPAGSNAASAVTISPTTDTIYSMTSAGSVTGGTAASFTQGTDSFTAPSYTVTSETLTIGDASFTQGSDTFTANTPTAVTLPSRSSAKTVWTGYNSGVSNTYAAAQTFTGTADTVSVSGSTNGVTVSAHSVTDNGHTHSVTVSGEVDKS